MALVSLQRILPLAVCLSAAFAVNAQTPPCTLTAPKLTYPDSAIAARISGPVSVSFIVDDRGVPRDLAAQGEPLLTDEAKSAYRYLRFPRPCLGRQISIVLKFRIDPNLPLEKPVALNRISPTEYELVSPARNLVVIADPPVFPTWPDAIPMEIRRIGDDALTVRLNSGDTALHIAAAAYRHEMLAQLINAGANPCARNRRGCEPLHAAAVGSPGTPNWNPTG